MPRILTPYGKEGALAFGFDAELTKKEKGRVTPYAGNQLGNLEAMGLSMSDLPYFYDYCRCKLDVRTLFYENYK